MLKIRVSDETFIEFNKGQNKLSKTMRKGTIAKMFKIEGDKIKFFSKHLDLKMIPKKTINDFESVPYKRLFVNSEELLLQDPSDSAHVIKYDETEQIFTPTKLEHLSLDDDIVVYDQMTEDWALMPVDDIKIIKKTNTKEEYNIIEDAISKNMSQNLSRYMIQSNYGIIINNILFI